MYEIRSEHGVLFDYAPKTYDMACRVAHFMRARVDFDLMVCHANGRATSEVFDHQTNKDSYAKSVARRLLP